MRTLYLDCFSGISGDMTLAALVDAGADRDEIEQQLHKLDIEPFTLEWKRVMKQGISALKVDVVVDHDQAPQHHRHYAEIVKHIHAAGFEERVVELSLAIFEKIAVSEAAIHNTTVDKVHFHEVGAIDSIVDIVGIALACHQLNIEHIASSPVPLGAGMVRCDHGLYPVPAPATLEMMKGVPIAPSKHRVELTTPTGAGVISGIVDAFTPHFPAMIVESIGYGAGTRDLPNQPNVLRCVIGTMQPQDKPIDAQHGHGHSHDHGHDHTHGHERNHGHDHGHDHEHEHDLGHEHTHEHEHGNDHSHGHDLGHEHTHEHDLGHEYTHEHEHGHQHTHDDS